MTNDLEKNINMQEDEISLKELILKGKEWCSYLWSKKWVIILVGIIGAGLGLGYSFIKKPIYTATTTFVLETGEKSGGLAQYAGVASMMGIDLGGGGGGIFQGDNILQLYQSRTMLEKTLLSTVEIDGKKQLLVNRFIEFNKFKDKWKEKPELLNLKFEIEAIKNGFPVMKPNRLRDSILGIIVLNLNKNFLSVSKPDKKLSTIRVDVNSIDESFAKAFNDELVHNVSDFYINTKTKKTLQNVRILQHKTDSVRAVMNGAIYTAIAVVDATPNLNPTRQIKRVAPSQTAQFSAETNKAILAEMVKNLEMTKMTLLRETPLIQVIDQPVFPLEREKLGKVKGIVFGGVISGFLICLFLVTRRFFYNILS